MAASASGIVAIPGLAATQKMGAITSWRLQGSFPLEDLAAAWTLHPNLLPSLAGPDVALRRAAQEHGDTEPLPGGGWAVVDGVELVEARGADPRKVERDVIVSVTLNPVGGLSFEPAGTSLEDGIRASFARHLTSLHRDDVSPWLSKMVKRANAVPLREGGGSYFVPPAGLPWWRAVYGALEKASRCRVFELPATCDGEKAVEYILDMVEQEAAARAAKLEEELASDDLGARALKTKARRAQEILAKVESYEGLLGASLDQLRKRVEDLKSGIAVALLSAESEEA